MSREFFLIRSIIMNLQNQIIHFIDKNTYYGPAMLMDIKVKKAYEQDSIVKLILRIFLREENHGIIVNAEKIRYAEIAYIINTTFIIFLQILIY